MLERVTGFYFRAARLLNGGVGEGGRNPSNVDVNHTITNVSNHHATKRHRLGAVSSGADLTLRDDLRQIHIRHLSWSRPSTPCKSNSICMYSALGATYESKPHPKTRTHTRMSGAGCLDPAHSPTARVHCRQMVDGTTARSTAPCLAMAAASQARAPAHLLAHPMSPHHPSPSESASALGQLLKCVSRRARAAGARLELLFDVAMRHARVRDAGGSVGGLV